MKKKENETLRNCPVILLCGGNGISFSPNEKKQIKGLVKIKNRPILHYILDHYAFHGAVSFYLAVGEEDKIINESIQLYLDKTHYPIDKINIVPTGKDSLTGKRILLSLKNLPYEDKTVAINYTDILSNADLSLAFDEFQRSNNILLLIGSKLPTRFRILGMRPGDDTLRGFSTKPVIDSSWINGGHYFAQRKMLEEFLSAERDSNFAFEDKFLEKILKDSKISIFRHHSLWHHLDHERDIKALEHLCSHLPYYREGF